MKYFVYIVRCADDSLYVGRSCDPKKRESEHNFGEGSKFTINKRPVRLVYVEELESRHEAYKREFQIKGWRREKKENLIKLGRPVE